MANFQVFLSFNGDGWRIHAFGTGNLNVLKTFKSRPFNTYRHAVQILKQKFPGVKKVKQVDDGYILRELEGKVYYFTDDTIPAN